MDTSTAIPATSNPESAIPARAILAAVLILAPAATAVPARADGSLTFSCPGAAEHFHPVPNGAGFTRFSMLDAIGIDAAAGTARLVIEVALPPGATAGSDPVDARVTYRPDGFRDYWQTADMPPPGAIVIDAVSLRGPVPSIAGRFRVTLCRRASVMVPADPGDCHPAEGSFDTQLQID